MKILELLKNLFKKKTTQEEAKVEPIEKNNSLISKATYNLLIQYESGGKSYYNSKLKNLQYTGGASGITGGIGYDFSFYTPSQIDLAWGKHFPKSTLTRLYKLKGLNGERARLIESSYRDIAISWDAAIEVFERVTIPSYFEQARKTFPCFDSLHKDVQGALVSLVFNRGTSLSGSSRKEMLNITKLTCSKDYKGIAREIRSMKRLWVGKNLDGLLKRREAEAKLVESAI